MTWKPVEGFEGLYKINRDGTIISLPRHGTKGGPMKWQKDGRGYWNIKLFKNGRGYNLKIHRLKMIHFSKRPDNYKDLEINHKNGIKTDLDYDNMEWATHGQNLRHAFTTGLRVLPFGENNHNSKLTDEKVIEILREVRTGLKSGRQIAREFGFAQHTIQRIAAGTGWKHIDRSKI